MNKIFKAILLLFVIIFCSTYFVSANVNESEYIRLGNGFLSKIQSGEYSELNSMYLKKAHYYFYVASKNVPPSVDALVGLGRVYMLQDKKEDAKNTLAHAYSVNPYNAEANFYYAEFFYKNDDFQTALKYYEQAKSLGYADDIKLNEMLLKCYSKLGDIEKMEEIK